MTANSAKERPPSRSDAAARICTIPSAIVARRDFFALYPQPRSSFACFLCSAPSDLLSWGRITCDVDLRRLAGAERMVPIATRKRFMDG